MDLLKQMADGFVWLIRSGVVLRVIFCLIRMSANEDEAAMYKRRIKHVLIFYIFAECIWQLKEIFMQYYS
jgi:hypothetical protein